MVAVLARNADFCTVLTWLKFYFLQMALLVVIGITPRAPTTGTTLVAWLSKCTYIACKVLMFFLFPYPVPVPLFAFNVVIASSWYIWGLYCCSVLSWTVTSGLYGDLSHDRFVWPWTPIMRFLIHFSYRIILQLNSEDVYMLFCYSIHVYRDITLLHVTSHDELLVPNDSKFVDTQE